MKKEEQYPFVIDGKLVSAEAVKAFKQNYDVCFNEEEENFWQMSNHIWRRLKDGRVRRLIAEMMKERAEPQNVDKVFKRLKTELPLFKLNEPSTHSFIPFKDGFLDIAPLLDFTRSVTERENLSVKQLNFQLYKDMPADEIRELGLIGVLPGRYNSGKEAPHFQAFLASTFEDQIETIPLVQEVLGYCLLFKYPFHTWFMFKGPGGNGKGVLFHCIRSLIGSDFCSEVNFSSLNKHSKFHLKNMLVNITDELPKSADWDLLKNLTGGGFTDAEIKHGPCIKFKSTAKMFFSANDTPAFSDASNGFWQRAIIIPFNQNIRGTSRDIPMLEQLIDGEIDEITSWALEGLIRLLKRGKFQLPPSCIEQLESIRTEVDSVRMFIDDRCIRNDRFAIYTSDMYARYRGYCISNGYKAFSLNNAMKRFEGTGLVKKRESSNVSPRRHYFEGLTWSYSLGRDDRVGDSALRKLKEVPDGFCIKADDYLREEDFCLQCFENSCRHNKNSID